MCGVRPVSDSCVYRFDSDSRGSGGKYRHSLKATATVLNQEDALCDLSTGVSVSQSLKVKPSDEGGGDLSIKLGVKLWLQRRVGLSKGLSIICSYEIGEDLIEPRAFGRAMPQTTSCRWASGCYGIDVGVDLCAWDRAVEWAECELLSSQKPHGGHQAVCFEQELWLCGLQGGESKVEGVLALRRRRFQILYQRGNQAAMQVVTDEITV